MPVRFKGRRVSPRTRRPLTIVRGFYGKPHSVTVAADAHEQALTIVRGFYGKPHSVTVAAHAHEQALTIVRGFYGKPHGVTVAADAHEQALTIVRGFYGKPAHRGRWANPGGGSRRECRRSFHRA